MIVHKRKICQAENKPQQALLMRAHDEEQKKKM